MNKYDSESVVVVNGFGPTLAHCKTCILERKIFKFIHVDIHICVFGKPALINYHVLMCINNGVLALTVALKHI